MQKKIVILILFLASLLTAQEQNSNVKNQLNFDKMTIISVTIGGSFIVNGTFPASTTERVDQFVTRLFNEARNAALTVARDEISQAKMMEQISKYSRRDITLKRSAGETIKIDLEKFRLTGDFKHNPYLKNDDILIFPEINLERNFIMVEGAVNLPGKYQFMAGDKLSDAILLARGINQAYDNVKEAEVCRLDKTGNNEEIIKAGINDIVELKAGDRIRVLAEENNKKDYKVLVLGEVKMPGYIFIKKNQTTIREVIEKAGDFTNSAWPENAEILRGTNSNQVLRMNYIKEQFVKNPEFTFSKFSSKFNYQNLEAMLISRAADITVEDSTALSVDNMLRLMYSPGLVDFTKLKDKSSNEGNFIVKDGDIILVPEKQDLVYLFGQVKSMGYIPYLEGSNYKYYLEKAGGKGEASDGDVKIIKAKSRTWVEADEKTVIEPGDMIYLPKTISHSFLFYLTQAGSIAGVLSALSTIVYFLFIAK